MRILKKLGFDAEKPSLTIVTSATAQGKSTVMIAIASELLKEGKKVLFISDDSEGFLYNRFEAQGIIAYFKNTKLISGVSSTMTSIGNLKSGNLTISRVMNLFNLKQLTQKEKFNCVFIDCDNSPQTLDEISFLKSLVSDKHIQVFVTKQGPRDGIKYVLTHTYPYTHFVIGVTKKEEFSLLEKLKYSILFRLNKPNFTLNLIKGLSRKTIDINIKQPI